jgi:hypothetical protein
MANLKKWIWLLVGLFAVLFVVPLLVGITQPPALQQVTKAPAVEAPALTKFGATLDDWNKTHILPAAAHGQRLHRFQLGL